MRTLPKQSNHSTGWLFLLLIGFLVASCKPQNQDIHPSRAYAPYIAAYTGGMISQQSAIRIELTEDQPMVQLHEELTDNPFCFSPSLSGKCYWVDNHTLEFVPEAEALQPGTLYKGTFDLGRFVSVDKPLKSFPFSFRVRERTFSCHLQPITITGANPSSATIKGSLVFSDPVTAEQVKGMLQVKSTPPATAAISATSLPTRFDFCLSALPRKAEDYTVTIRIDGRSAHIKQTHQQEVTIPGHQTFRLLEAYRTEVPENGLELIFSDPISLTQDLKGLIQLNQVPHFVTQVQDNRMGIFFEEPATKSLELTVHEGIKNEAGQPLEHTQKLSFSERNLKPQVKMNQESAILPNSQKLLIPFAAVNLHAVDLSVIRIYESNLMSFLQNNSLSTSDELRRYGRLIYKKTLWLNPDGTKNIHQWNQYSIDLAELIQQEPGAIYRVILSMRPEYSAYPCGNGKNLENNVQTIVPEGLIHTAHDGISNEEKAHWDKPFTYYYYNGLPEIDWSTYQWSKRDDPCHPTYFMDADRSACCNVLASNIGLTVKQNSNHQLWIAVNNILTTAPIEKARIQVYNFQLQPIGEGISDGNGWAQITPEGVPFLVIAEWKKQKSYVRVVDGEELSVSQFDVSGKKIQKGLKGFLYGERGVWRPGDTLHLTFLLDDQQQRIPDNHPVTLEIYNPQGQFFTKRISTQGMNGFYTFPVVIPADAPTGIWNAYVKVGGSTFHQTLRIESIKPNRLKLQLDLPRTFLSPQAQKRPLQLSATWLTGAQAAHLKAKVEVSLSRVEKPFPAFSSYHFNNPATEFTTVRNEIFQGKLDGNGRVAFPWNLPAAEQAPGILNATFTSRVFEPGGDASFFTQSIPYAPFESYVGIQLPQPDNESIETDQDYWFNLVTVDAQGRLINRNNLEYKIYHIDWNWWWENNHQSLGNYIQQSSVLPVASGRLQTTGGKARLKFRIHYPEWGRYLVYVKDRESGHATGGVVFVDWPEWRGRSKKENPDGIQMLTFTLDKKSYEVGETVTATLPASAGGRALVSLENGSTVLQQQWIEVEPQKDTPFSFITTSEMAPNVYLHISLLQPHAQTINDLPIRMYGIQPVFIHNPQTVLHPEIQLPSVLKPEQQFQVTVGEKQGRAMTYTLALVDEGLLDITRFQTPNPWDEFYAREALGIRTWDLYNHVLGAFAGRYGQLFSTGGDATLKPLEEKANRFKPVVQFMGPFHLKAGRRQSHTLTLPAYIGSVRVMVVAGQNGAYGCAQRNAYVRTPLMLQSTLPRTLSIQEEIEVPVHLFSMGQEIPEANVSLQILQGDVHSNGPMHQTVRLDRNGEALTFFRLRTGCHTGKAVIQLTASGQGHQAKEKLEIDLRNPNPAVTLTHQQWVEKGATVTLTMPEANSGPLPASLTFEASRLPTVNLTQRFDFLYHYPHLCTEQLVSKGLPLLFVESFRTLEPEEKTTLQTNIQRCIQQVYSRQLANGGFSYWPGESVANEWVTSYAGLFLTLAQEKGYALSQQVWRKWKRFQQSTAQNASYAPNLTRWQRTEQEMQQAFRLYTLALANAPEYGAMNRMKEQKSLSTPAKWRLAATYALMEKMQPANELIFGTQPTAASYDEPSLLFGSSLRDEAMILETHIRMKRDSEARTQAQRLVRQLNAENEFSTQSTAFSLMALALYSQQLSGTLEFNWLWNDQPQPAVKSARSLFLQALAPTAHSPQKVTVTNRGTAGIQAALTARIQPLKDTLPALNQGIKLAVQYQDLQGRPLSVQQLTQGTDFQVSILVSNQHGTQPYENLALTYLLPSGWEFYHEHPTGTKQSTDYADYRDDRMLTYFHLQPGEQKQFIFRLQASYLGKFNLPAVQCEAMYNPQIVARTRAGHTQVVR